MHAPLQPVNAEPAAGVAAKLIAVPAANAEEQVEPQLTPAGALVIVPVPVPDLLTASVNCGTNVACTATSEFTGTVQEPVPEQAAPVQPAKEEPAAAVAVRVTLVPESNCAAHVLPQLIPAGALVTVPAPAPLTATDSANCGAGGTPKFATTVRSTSRVTVHPPVPAQAPPHPVNADPWAGATVRATAVPETKLVEQVLPQLIPAGLLIIVPPADGFALTERLCGGGAEDDGVFVGVPAPLFPVSVRTGVDPPPPPHATSVKDRSTTNAMLSITRHPPTWFTNRSCPGALHRSESEAQMLARK